jgi:hypothetical protein
MTINPIFEAVKDYEPVGKTPFRNTWLGFALAVNTVAEVQAMDTRGQKLLWVAGKLYEYVPSNTTTPDDNGLTCIIDLSLTRRFILRVTDGTAAVAAHVASSNPHTLKADLVSGKVPTSQLPSYVDDIIEVANFASLPVTGLVNKVYVTLNGGKSYRWGGTAYVDVSASTGLGAHIDAINPHEQYGLSYANRTTVAAANLSTLAAGATIEVRGHTVEGIGEGIYTKLASAPSSVKAWHLQSFDGSWFLLLGENPNLFQLGGRGIGSPSASVDTLAFQAAADYERLVLIPKGDYRPTTTILLSTGSKLRGEGRWSEIYPNFMGALFAGKSVTPATGTNVRIFDGGLQDIFCYSLTSRAAGSIGIDARGMSKFKFQDVVFQNFQTGVKMGGGYATYNNEFCGVEISGVTTGYDSSALANENLVIGGRINDCVTCTIDSDNSHNKYIGVELALMTNGHVVNAPTAVGHLFFGSRIEIATTGIHIDASAQGTQIFMPTFIGAVTTPIFDDSGDSLITSSIGTKFGGGEYIKKQISKVVSVNFGTLNANSSKDLLIAVPGVPIIANTPYSLTLTENQNLPSGIIVDLIPFSGSGNVYFRALNVTTSNVFIPTLDFRVGIWFHP